VGLLGPVHRQVGAPHQIGPGVGVVGVKGDPDTHAGVEGQTRQVERFPKGLDDQFRGVDCFVEARSGTDYQCELVAAYPGEQAEARQGSRQAGTELEEQFIAHGVP